LIHTVDVHIMLCSK